MTVPSPHSDIPPQAVVEVYSEPTPDLLAQRLTAVTALLRMALLSGMEMALPTAMHLMLDMCGQIVSSDRQLVVLSGDREHLPRLQVARQFDSEKPPEIENNLLHHWVMLTAKPLLVQTGLDADMDQFLERVGATAGLGVPLFLEHEVAGSLQIFRSREPAFANADAQLLWILSLLTENQMSRISSQQKLTHMAFTDFLTGLRTRGYFEKELEQEIRRTLRKGSSCGLLLLDLDDFKRINDYYGHHAGDEILRQFARVLTRDMRDIDTVARFGGDEFSVILPDTDGDGARFVATRLRESVRHAHFHLPELNLPLQLHVSIGVALCPQDETDPGQLIRAADLALYQAKRQGKDRLFFWRELRKSG